MAKCCMPLIILHLVNGYTASVNDRIYIGLNFPAAISICMESLFIFKM